MQREGETGRTYMSTCERNKEQDAVNPNQRNKEKKIDNERKVSEWHAAFPFTLQPLMIFFSQLRLLSPRLQALPPRPYMVQSSSPLSLSFLLFHSPLLNSFVFLPISGILQIQPATLPCIPSFHIRPSVYLSFFSPLHSPITPLCLGTLRQCGHSWIKSFFGQFLLHSTNKGPWGLKLLTQQQHTMDVLLTTVWGSGNDGVICSAYKKTIVTWRILMEVNVA